MKGEKTSKRKAASRNADVTSKSAESKSDRDTRLTAEAYHRADAWARSIDGTPYGPLTPTLNHSEIA